MKPLPRLIAALTLAALALPLAAETAPAPAAATTEAAPKAKTRVALIKLSNSLLERPADFSFSFFSGIPAKSPALSNLIVTLNKAAKDPTLGGVVLDLKSFHLTLSQAQELTPLLQSLRTSKKRLAVFAPDFDTPTYLLASNADTIIMPENGDVLIPGVSFGMAFFKGMLDNIKVKADMVQIGKFKGAEEPFTRTEASPELKAQIDALADAMYAQIVTTIAHNRQLKEDEAKAAIDEAWLTGKRAKALGLVDKLIPRDKLDAWVNGQFPDGADILSDYGERKKKNIDMDNPFAIFQIFAAPKPVTRTSQPAIAVIYADGEITNDTPEGSSFSEEAVTPSKIRKAVEKALKDDLVRAIVLRVDSPGGSASASDEIWQIIKDADKKKPVTVSMGRVAASGGYYIACAGRSITADEATITGSIGVVGGKIVLKGLADWAGINIQPVERGKRAGILSAMRPFTDDERTFIRNQMTEVYDLFTKRVTDSRGTRIAKIEDVAQGRLFAGPAAQKAGLVDHVGTLSDTILAAARTAKIDKNYQIIVLPEQKTLADIFREGFAMDAKLPFDLSTALPPLKAAPPELRREVMKAFLLLDTMQKEKVLAAWPVGLIEQ